MNTSLQPDRARIRNRDLATAAAIGGVVLVTLAAGIDGSAMHPVLPFGNEPLWPFRAASRGVGLDALKPVATAMASIVSVIAATVAFLYALRAAWRGDVSVRLVVVLGLAFIALAVALPLLFSRDVYSYAFYGRVASIHHANPYVSIPSDFQRDPLFELVGPQWRDTTAVYGPGFTLLSEGLTRWLQGTVALIWAYKVIAGAAAAATVLLVSRLASRLWPERAAFATALVAWNPVVLFHAVGGGHNDLLVGLSVVGALTLLAGRRPTPDAEGAAPSVRRELLATAVLALGTLVKASAAVPLVLAVVVSVWRRPRSDRPRVLALHVGVAAGLGLVFAAPYFQAKDPTFGLATLATHEGWLAPSRFFRVLLGQFGHAVAGDVGETVMHGLVRIVFPIAFVWAFALIVRYLAANARGLDAKSEGASWGWALLVATLAAPVLLPWYMVWVLPVVWLLPGTARRGAIVLSAVLTISQTVAAAVSYPTIFHATLFIGHYILTPVLFVTLVLLLRDLRRRLRDGTGLSREIAAPAEGQREVAAAARGG